MKTSDVERKKGLLSNLSGIIGQKIKLAIHTEIKDWDLGSMTSGVSEPLKRDSEISIIFLGIYGLSQNPIYVHGINESGKDVLFRNNLDIWVNEDTGIPNHENKTVLKSLGDIDIEALFRNSWFHEKDKTDFETKIRNAEPDDKYLAEKILRGQPGYYPASMSPRWSPSYSMFDEPKFVEKVITYLEKIV